MLEGLGNAYYISLCRKINTSICLVSSPNVKKTLLELLRPSYVVCSYPVPIRQVTGVLSELQAASQEKHVMTKALGDVKHSYFNNMDSLASVIGHEVC